MNNPFQEIGYPIFLFHGLVQINEIAYPINATEILDHLSAIKQAKQHYPSFDWGYYYNPQAKKSNQELSGAFPTKTR